MLAPAATWFPPGVPYFSAVRAAAFVNGLHDVVKTVVDFFATSHGIRMLFCAISRPEVATPPALAALPGPNRIFASRNRFNAFDRGRHVRAFRHDINAVLQQIRRVPGIDFVLRGTRKCALRLVIPERVVIERRVDAAM